MKTLLTLFGALTLAACDTAGDPPADTGAGDPPAAVATGDTAASEARPERPRRRGKRRAAFAERMKKFDTNGDGTLDATERATMRADRKARQFSRLDSDGSGAISKDEAAAARRRARRILEDFDAVDTDGSGDISQTELETRMSELRAKRREHRRSKRGATE